MAFVGESRTPNPGHEKCFTQPSETSEQIDESKRNQSAAAEVG
jgi:hypothetical protein